MAQSSSGAVGLVFSNHLGCESRVVGKPNNHWLRLCGKFWSEGIRRWQKRIELVHFGVLFVPDDLVRGVMLGFGE